MKDQLENYIYRGGALIGALFVVFIVLPFVTKIKYNSIQNTQTLASVIGVANKKNPNVVPLHVSTPKSVKALYVSSWVAGTLHLRDRIIEIADTTEINALVIDIKDNSGKISFKVDSRMIENLGASENRIDNIEALIHILHGKNIYIIGRIAVFQDEYIAHKWPDQVIQNSKKEGEPWKDIKGAVWLDPGGDKIVDYIAEIAKVSYEIGFDEINFDYVEFPTEETTKEAIYPLSGKSLNEGKSKDEIIENFFSSLHKKISSKITTSVTLSNTDNQNLSIRALPYFDYVVPVLYPSSFPPQWNGYENPSTEPYNVVFDSMAKLTSTVQSSGDRQASIRPWLQDFNFGTSYTKDMVRLEMQAVYDSGNTSWMLWDPSNLYTTDALLIE